jgi:hypothetical protein
MVKFEREKCGVFVTNEILSDKKFEKMIMEYLKKMICRISTILSFHTLRNQICENKKGKDDEKC